MSNLTPINYKNIIKLFNLEYWDFSYLTHNEMMEVLNFPIKFGINKIEKYENENENNKDANYLIIVKQTENYDYSLEPEFLEIFLKHFPHIQISKFWCNYKYAAVKAGLGQYAKNSLFYHPRFQFETHIFVAKILNPITFLPVRNKSNFNYLEQCKNCNDCFKNCPAQAIHNQNNFPWIDTEKCNNFCSYGNHDKIPSIKQNYILLQHLSQEEKKEIKNFHDLNNIIPDSFSSYININNKEYWYQYPICRECTSQPKCSKYNGKYPYDSSKTQIKIIKKET